MVDQGFFQSIPHETLDFSTNGDGDPVIVSGAFDMLVEYAPLGLQFDNAAFFGLQWRLIDELPFISGDVLASVSPPVMVDSFGMTTVAFDEPMAAVGVTIVIEDTGADLYFGAGDDSMIVDDTMIIATETIGLSTYHAIFIGFESPVPVTSFTFGYPQGGTVMLDDLLYDLSAPPCPADLNNDGVVDTADLGLLISNFGNTGSSIDINGDGLVDTADLGLVIGAFGSECP